MLSQKSSRLNSIWRDVLVSGHLVWWRERLRALSAAPLVLSGVLGLVLAGFLVGLWESRRGAFVFGGLLGCWMLLLGNWSFLDLLYLPVFRWASDGSTRTWEERNVSHKKGRKRGKGCCQSEDLLQFYRGVTWWGILVFQPWLLPRNNFIVHLDLKEGKARSNKPRPVSQPWLVQLVVISHVVTLFAAFAKFLCCRSFTALSVMLFDRWRSLGFGEALSMIPGDLGHFWEQTQVDLHQQRSRKPVRVSRTPGSLLQMLLGCFGRNLCALLPNDVGIGFATTDSNWWSERQLIGLCWTVGGAGAGVWILHTARWTMTIQDQRHRRLGSNLTLVMWRMLRSPLIVFFSLTSVLIFPAGTHFRLDLRLNCEAGVSV